MRRMLLCVPIIISLMLSCAKQSGRASYNPPKENIVNHDTIGVFSSINTEKVHRALFKYLKEKPDSLNGDLILASTFWEQGYTVVKLSGQPNLSCAKDSSQFRNHLVDIVKEFTDEFKIHIGEWVIEPSQLNK